MQYEYKTEELKMYYTEQERVMNELAHEGWELISVSFNIGYFRRPNATTNAKQPPFFVKYGDAVLNGTTGKIAYIDEASIITDSQFDKIIKPRLQPIELNYVTEAQLNSVKTQSNKTIKGKGKKR